MSNKKKSGVAKGYLHGFTKDEQDRLYAQARFLEPSVFERVDFSRHQRVLEVGCGVGAQTEILLERFSQPHFTCIDASGTQIARAKKRLASAIKAGRVDLHVGDALATGFADDHFDGAFVCWFLEHVRSPVEILSETRRVMKTGADIFVNEVLNATFYVHPYSPATQQYWLAFNDHQWNLGGDPFVGAKLANYLLRAGFQNVKTNLGVFHYDNRTPKLRAQFINYWTSLLLSGADALIAAGRVTKATVTEMTAELARLKDDADAVFFYSFVRAHAQAF